MTKTILLAMLTLALLMSEASAQSRSDDDFFRVIKNSESATIKTYRGDTTTWAESRLYPDGYTQYFDASGRLIRVIKSEEPPTNNSTNNSTGICRAFRWNPPDD